MAKYIFPVVLQTNWFSHISAGQAKQSALQVQTAGGLSFPTTKVEGRPPNTLSLQLTPPSKEGSYDEAEAHLGEGG